MAAQEPLKESFQPFSETLRASQSEGILDGFFNGIRAKLTIGVYGGRLSFALSARD
jgi:hypothetical protein